MVRGRGRRAVLVALVVAGAGGGAAPAGAAPVRPAKAVVVAAAPSAAVWSQPVRLTASVTPRGGGAPQGGTVTFLDGTTPIGTATATTRNTTLTTAGLGPGEHVVRVRYEGDAATAPTTSGPITVTITRAATTVALAAHADPVAAGEPAELRAVVLATAPASTVRRPTGTVTFARGTARATVPVNANGVATWRPRLPVGTHTVTATYDGSATHATSVSEPVTQEVVAHVVDQVSEGPWADETKMEDSATEPAEQRIGQVFTAGRTGALDAVSLRVRSTGTPSGPLKLGIRAAVDGRPTGPLLGSGTLDPGVVPPTSTGWLDVPLASPAAVTAGSSYALVLEPWSYGPTETSAWWFGLARGDSHPGTSVYVFGDEEWIRTPGWDLLFRTWVRPV